MTSEPQAKERLALAFDDDRGSSRSRWVAGALVLALVGWMGSGFILPSDEPEAAAEQAPTHAVTVAVSVSEAEPVMQYLVAEGQAQPDRDTIILAETAGRIAEVLVARARTWSRERWSRGSIWPSARRTLPVPRRSCAGTRREFDNAETLLDRGSATVDRVTEARAALAAAEARLAAARGGGRRYGDPRALRRPARDARDRRRRVRHRRRRGGPHRRHHAAHRDDAGAAAGAADSRSGAQTAEVTLHHRRDPRGRGRLRRRQRRSRDPHLPGRDRGAQRRRRGAGRRQRRRCASPRARRSRISCRRRSCRSTPTARWASRPSVTGDTVDFRAGRDRPRPDRRHLGRGPAGRRRGSSPSARAS